MRKLILLPILFAGLVHAQSTSYGFINKVVDNGISLAASVNGTWMLMESGKGFAIQAVTTSSAVGSLKLQASAELLSTNASTNNQDVSGTTQAVAAAGTYIWNLSAQKYRWVRIVYTRTSGTGTLTSTYNENLQ